MEISDLMPLLGGVAERRMLISLTSRRAVEEAIDSQQIVRINRGRYAVPGVHEGTKQALRVSGHVCLVTAALSCGWEVKAVPDRPQVAVPKDRRLTAEARADIEPFFVDLADDELEGLSTNDSTTLEMCGRRLPFDDALAIADSALRAGYDRDLLVSAAAAAKGPGSARFRRVAAHADARSANPFESVLRALALDVPGLGLEPQMRIRGRLGLDVRPDLVDRTRHLVLEADSFAWHGNRAALRRDARRYDLLVVNGWTVLRFSWEDVMHDQVWVTSVLAAAVERTDGLSPPLIQA